MLCYEGEDDEEQRPEAPRVRKCTDVFWLCLFIIFWFLMIMIAAFALVYGNPLKLINGYDSFGNICGTKNNPKFVDVELSGQDTSDKPYLFFLDMRDLKQSLKICVKECPNRHMNYTSDVCQFYKSTGSKLCYNRPDIEFTACSESGSKNKPGYCPRMPVYKSTPVLKRCVPKSASDIPTNLIYNLYSLLNSWDIFEQILGDLCKTWREILALSFLAFVLSLFMIAIFHLFASMVTWVVMILVSISSIAGTGLLWWTYTEIKCTLDKQNPNELLEESVRNERAFLVFAIIATVITTILLFILIFLRKRIEFMKNLFKESAKCLAEIPGLFIQPFLTFSALLGFYAFWITIVLSLATANYPGEKPFLMLNSSGNIQLFNSGIDADSLIEQKRLDLPMTKLQKLTLVEYVDATWVKYMWWVYIIGFIWISEFISACQELVIAGAVAHWYFRSKNANSSPVCSSIGKLVSYHLGSVACGSLLITIFKLPRLILTYIHKKLERSRETSACAQCGLKSCICCFYCLETFIRFLNHNAYTVVAIEGTNFCKSAKIAFSTLSSNALQLAIVNGIGDFILFLGKCFVTVTTGSIALLFMRQDSELHFYAVPIFIVCTFSFFIAHCVISLFEIVIDTLFLCVCEDQNLNGENGRWKQSSFAQIGSKNTSTNGQHELSPMNQ